MSSMRLRHKRKISEDSSDKDDRAKQKKRKVSELGPAWAKEELEVFYRAFRKHGKNWKKVASVMRNRTIDMVEALYNANAGYLCLPEGAASASGFIAKVTEDGQGRPATKPSKSQSNSGSGQTAPGIGGPSPAKKPRTNRPRVAGNKLPHFLVESKSGTQQQDENDSDEYDFNNVVKAVAMTLAEASQNDSENPDQTGQKAQSDEEVSEGVGNGSTKRKPQDTSDTATKPDSSSPNNAQTKGRRPPSKRLKMMRENAEEQTQVDENKTRERESAGIGVTDGSKQEAKTQPRRVMPPRKKRGRQLFSGDQNSGLDTLATLADHLLPKDGLPKGDDGSADPQEFQDLVSLLNLDRVKKESEDVRSPDAKKKRNSRRAEKALEASSSRQEAIVYRPNGRPKRIPKTSKRHEDYEHDLDKLEDSGSNHGDVEPPPKPRGKKKSVSEIPVESKSKAPARLDRGRPSCSHVCAEYGAYSTKARLLHCLSGKPLRQWCMYEWLYSPIDWPWFDRNEFCEYLHHAGLGHVSKLTRTEWGVIRSSLGKPRRFSPKFLHEERDKLETYRESVRTYYQDIRNGVRDALPPDIARPLCVGQRVSARHPKTGELHDGNVLTVERNRCRVQFDRPDLGVEFVWDINAMPVDQLENMSEQMRKRRIMAQKFAGGTGNERVDGSTSGHTAFPPTSHALNDLFRQAQMDNVDSVMLAKAQASEVAAAVQQGQPHSSAHAQAREADIRALAELQKQLDKKEALLVELRRMNDDVVRVSGDDEVFKRQYATVVLQLREVNDRVSSALMQLRQRNRYQENAVPPWHSPSCPLDGYSGLSAGSPAEEVTFNARKEARSLVSATVQAICCLKEGEDTSTTVGNEPAKDGGMISNANHHQAEQLNSSDKGDSLQSAGTEESKNQQWPASEAAFTTQMEAFIPTELIAACVAPLLMVKTCTERHLPPCDVAAMFENALATLRPRSAQNHQLYKEIEQYFDVIKNQVTAQVSIHPNLAFPVDCQLR